MRRPRHRWLVFAVLGLAGCSSTGGTRVGEAPRPRSIAVVGDRPLPSAVGEPGAQVAADVAEPEPTRNAKARISGRVVDQEGRGVPEATVRLADNGVRGGRDLQATTDRSGAFTLSGLRPGSNYVLIAEYEDGDGPLTGREQARTSETGVEIVVSARSESSPTRSTKVRPISNRLEVEEPETEVNKEDLATPALEAEPVVARTKAPRAKLANPEAAGWRTPGSAAKAQRNTDADTLATAASEEIPPRAASPGAGDDEGPNPLPPAIEVPRGGSDPADAAPETSARPAARKVSARKPRGTEDPGAFALASEVKPAEPAPPRSEPATEPKAAESAATPPPGFPDPLASASPAAPSGLQEPPAMPSFDTPAVVSNAPPGSPPTAAPPPDLAAAAQPATPPNPAPEPVFASPGAANPASALAAADPSSDYNPFALPPVAPASTDGSLAPRGPEPVARAEGPAARSAPAEAPPAPAAEEPPATNPPAPPGSRKKWGDLASLGKPPIVVEPTSARVAARPRREASRDRDKDPAIALCDYDPRLRKLKDFRLPDLDGKPVRFQDLDADYILLDFWGTWCTPCLDSVPHLVDLQKQYGPSRLRVVGIACENIAPEKRKARVDEYTRKLNINYAVLLSGMNGPCPLLEAFQVQVFPTMILLNRRGEVLWRESGSKPPTMARLDRVLASSTRGDTVRR